MTEGIISIMNTSGSCDLISNVTRMPRDPLYYRAVRLVMDSGQASASFLQKRLRIGDPRASRLIDEMEAEKLIGPAEGAKPREILADPTSCLEKMDDQPDPLYEKAAFAILRSGRASAAFLQKTLRIGFERAARIIDHIEVDGIIGPFETPPLAREILVDPEDYLPKRRNPKS